VGAVPSRGKGGAPVGVARQAFARRAHARSPGAAGAQRDAPAGLQRRVSVDAAARVEAVEAIAEAAAQKVHARLGVPLRRHQPRALDDGLPPLRQRVVRAARRAESRQPLSKAALCDELIEAMARSIGATARVQAPQSGHVTATVGWRARNTLRPVLCGASGR
jgi:hypothetical protein